MTSPEPPAPTADETPLERSEEAIRSARAAADDLSDEGGLVPPDEADAVQPPG